MSRLVWSWLFCLLAIPVEAAQSPPNILLLMAEDMSPRVGAFGDPVAHTPNLDRLAAQGVRYTQVFTTAGVCAPSRAAHILGMHQSSTGTQHMRSGSRPEGGYQSVPPEDVKAYPQLLRAAGYYTYTDEKLDYQFSGSMAGSGPVAIWDRERADLPGWRGREAGQPFFGLRNFMVTHESGVFPPLGSWPNSVMHLAVSLMRWWRGVSDIPEVVAPEQVVVPPYYPDIPVVRRDIARHYNNIAAMDAQVGELLAQLESDGLADNTIVIWTTDHGDGLPRGKRELYDTGIHVPMIIRWPEALRPAGVEPGAIDSRLISFVDFAPTVLSLAGVALPDYLQGQAFHDPQAQPREYVFAARDRIDEVPDRQRAVRSARYKYIRSGYPELGGGHPLAFRDNIDMVRQMRAMYEAGELDARQRQWFEAPGRERLFDLEVDPFELNDLHADPEYQDVLATHRAALGRWQARVGDREEETEAELVARIMPGGEQGETPAPTGARSGGVVTLRGASKHHSLSWRVDGGPWKLYTAPVVVAQSAKLEAKAERYGWKPSSIITVP